MLKEIIENHKCCGNCHKFDITEGEENRCPYSDKTIYPNGYCPYWESDQMTQSERDYKFY